MLSLKQKAQELLKLADIKINPSKKEHRSFDIQVHNEKIYSRFFSQGSLGLGEAYMDNWFDVEKLDEFIAKILSSKLDKKVKTLPTLILFLKSKVLNLQSKYRAFEVGEKHYNVGNDLYKAMLDERLTYTCGYWKSLKPIPQNLDKAQEQKLDLVCKKLNLKAGQKILDIGCGWGSFMKYAAEKYKVKCVGVTVSKEQVELGKKLCKNLDIKFRLQDYRELLDSSEKFDHVVSLGMFEHVGCKNYKEFFKIVNHVLKDKGLFLLHTIGGNKSVTKCDAWFDKYIFPNGMLPSIKQIGEAIEDYFVMEDWHNFGTDYDKTLMAWFHNFDKAWPKLKAKRKYNERFYRMWKYYLLSMAGAFRARRNQLWQIVLSKNGVEGGYESIR